MTQFARRTAATGSDSSVVLAAQWRVGVRGSLRLTVQRTDDDGAVRACVELDARRRVSAVLSGAAVDSEGELRLVLAPAAAGDTDNTALDGHHPCVIAVCAVDGAAPVLITDLPARIGLGGGTYVLESLQARI